MVSRNMEIFVPWESIQHGEAVSFACQVFVRGAERSIASTLERPARRIEVIGKLPISDATCFVILEAKVVQARPPVVEVGELTYIAPIPACDRKCLNRVVELCCGLGAFSSVCSSLDFQPLAGVDTNDRWEPLFKALHSSGAAFLHGECGDPGIIRKLHDLGAMHCVLLSGVSCQPFSIGGDRRGLGDPRSISLPHTLRTAWLLQAPVILLECTPEIQKDPEVQALLTAFRDATGCFITQTVLALQDVWCTKRERWFAILTAGPIGAVHVSPPPVLRDCHLVGLVMPYVREWPSEDLQQLELSLYELSRYYSLAASGIQKAFLDLKAQLPTLLHSCGNQLYDCQCGCRKALSPERIASRGLFGTIVSLGGFIRHENQNLQRSRYFHPKEMYLLQGGVPNVDFGSNHRLALAGIGQCVSPLIATWILAHVRAALMVFVGEPPLDPVKALEDHIDAVLDARDVLWPTPFDRADFIAAEHPIRVWDHASSSMVEFKCSHSATFDHFLAAERALQRFLRVDEDLPYEDPEVWAGDQKCCFGGSMLDSMTDLSLNRPEVPRALPALHCPCLEFDQRVSEAVVEVSPTVPFSLNAPAEDSPRSDVLSLLDKPRDSLMSLVCPRLSSSASVPTLLNRVLPGSSRAQILTNQADAWADDEIRFFLHQIVDCGSPDQRLILWDPLALSSVVRFANFNLLQELVACVPAVATVISACVIDGHWYAVCWRCEQDSVRAFTCGHPCNMSMALQRVHQEFCGHRSCNVIPITFRSLPFVADSCCGALAVAYLRHLVFGVSLPETKPVLQEFHISLRTAFAAALAPSVPRPWIWGLGTEIWRQKLDSLLQEHGVELADVADRATMVISKLGESKVATAVSSGSPWKELKWLANSMVPPLQLIRPLELKRAIEKRTLSDAPVGRRAQKSKGKGKGKAVSPQQIDPNGLRIEKGIFQCGDGLALQQLDLSHVGPMASGIVLTSLDAALPYLKSGKQISAGGLGFVLVNCQASQVPTVLIPEPIRVPAICVANSEPVLVDAVLYQLGAQPVSRRAQHDACSIVTLASCVVKILAFKDQLDVAWETFSRHPMKHIFCKVPPLVACADEDCIGCCEGWHTTPDCQLENPVMELWGKQWLLVNFSQVPAAQAELFTVHVRVPSCLAVQLQTYSGVAGIFLEPKHVDGKQASESFQVFWLPRLSFQEVLHLKQTTPHIIGLARMGEKFGVRCKADCAEQVHTCIKPGGSFLPPGKKTVYLLGPLPFGTIRSSLVDLLASISWVARPLQPVAAAAHVCGVMWKIQAVSPPPVAVVPTDKGDVVITKLEDAKPVTVPSSSVVAASRTIDLCMSGAPLVDPLQVHDPWANASRVPSHHGPDPVVELEKKVCDAVLAKLPREPMDVDCSDEQMQRVGVLERQVQELREGQQGLHSMLLEQGRTQGHQISCLQQQTQKIEGAVAEHNHSLASFQAQFSSQLAQQETRLDSLFRQQMDKLEDLFSKKARHEWWGLCDIVPQSVAGVDWFDLWLWISPGLFILVFVAALCPCYRGDWFMDFLSFVLLLVWIPISVRFACWWSPGSNGVSQSRSGSQHVARFDMHHFVVGRGFSWPPWLRLFLLCGCRVGEALHPGPVDSSLWTCGIFNPSGLTTKTDFVSQIDGDIWLGSETHLTRSGLARPRHGLRAQKSRFTSVVAGAPCAQRVQADAGSYAGVIALSAYPARSLPHAIDPELFASARVLVCGIAIRQMWIQVGVAYGYPQSAQHAHRTYRTECLLEELITRVAVEGTGPRIVCGDFNHPAGDLLQIQRLRHLGFCEVQDIALCKWGYEIQPTSTGPHVIDQLWISPELQALLEDVSVSWDDWSSHASVVASFRHLVSELDRPSWNLPAPFPWPASWPLSCSTDWSDPSLGFASWWYQVEQSAASCLPSGSVRAAACGRGQTLSTVLKKPSFAPCKLGRPGDLQPQFFGSSIRHTWWFKQLRRLHSLSRLLHSGSHKPSHGVKQVELWKAIKCAPGFNGGFCSRWLHRFPSSPFDHFLPVCVPEIAAVDCMLAQFRQEVRQLETDLGAARALSAKQRRLADASLVFKDCMRDSPQPVDSLVRSQVVEVDELRHDDCSVVLTRPAALDSSVALVAHVRAFSILACCHDQVWLDTIEHLQVGDSLRQEKVVSTDQGLLQEFASVWKDRWFKHSHVLPSQWDDICAFARRHFRPVHWDFPEWTLARVRSTLKGRKKTAATGPDGISRHDLLALPDAGLVPILDLFRHLESGGGWPTQLVQGFVNCLDKQKGDGGVDSYRPVVVYPVITRLWSSVRARQALACAASVFPSGLHGGVPNKQAKTIWYHLAQLVETSHFGASSLQGVAVDIQRAFNNLPREPIWCTIIQLGFPAKILLPWASFLVAQARRFRIRGAVGEPLLSNCGYPEGCAFSVFAMGICDMMLSVWMDSQCTSPLTTYTYVDDWHLVYVSPDAFDMIWSALTSFASLMQLPLDLGKSFCWASQSADRKMLCGGPVSSVLAVRDLGAHQNFSLKSGNRTLLDRLVALADLWPKLRRSVSPYWVKLHVLTQMAWPRGLHGISVVHLGLQRFVSLRAGAMKGLGVNRIGANPLLRFMQHGVLCDPEGWAVIQTVRELREVGSLEQMEAMLDFAARGELVPPNGPCAILIARLGRLGWTLHPGGQFRDVFGLIDVLRCSWTAFLARVQFSWPRLVAAEVSHRPSLSGIQFADIAEVRKVLRSLGPSDRKILQCCLDGTLYQDIKKSKSQRGSGSLCSFCQGLDSPFHRVWECRFFEKCRTLCGFRALVPKLAPCLSCHGWPLVPPSWYKLCDWFLSVPPVELVVSWPTVPPDHTFHLFVDGSCSHPAEAKLRFAAWGVTLAATSPSSLDHQILACGHVQGLEQTAYRGELEAMLHALKLVAAQNVRAVIWSDCESVVKRVRRVLTGRTVQQNRPHADLWQGIADLVASRSLTKVTIQKVASHCPSFAAEDAVEAWAFWQNKLVDCAVGAYNMKRPESFWLTWIRLRDELSRHREVHATVVDVLLQVGRSAMTLVTKVDQPTEVPAAPPPTLARSGARHWMVDGKVAKLYRQENVEKLHSWWLKVGVPALSSRVPMRWVSGFQLWADFALSMAWDGPLSPNFRQWYLGPDDAPNGVPRHLGARAKSFLRMWKGYTKSNGFVVPGKVKRPYSYALGYWTNCYLLPWSVKRLQLVDKAIFELKKRQIAQPIELEAFELLMLREEAVWD